MGCFGGPSFWLTHNLFLLIQVEQQEMVMFKNYHTGEMEASCVEQRAGQFFIKSGFAGHDSEQNYWGFSTPSAAKQYCLEQQNG